MAPIAAVFFDLDETLLDDDASMRRAVAAVCASLAEGYGLSAERLSKAYIDFASAAWAELGSVTATDVLRDGRAIRVWMWTEVLGKFDPRLRAVAERAAEQYSLARRRTYALFEDVIPAIESLAASYRLGVVTNGPGDTQREKLGALELDRYFETVVVSGDAGVGKPDPAIFGLALEALDLEPHRAVHVGDSLASDVAGAARAGIHTVWLNRSGAALPRAAVRPGTTIDTLVDLSAVVSRIREGAAPSS